MVLRCFRWNRWRSSPFRPEPGPTRFLTGVPEGQPIIAQRFIAGPPPKDKESPVGTKEISLRFLAFEPKRPVVPGGLWPKRSYPSDESLGYSLSPYGLNGTPFHRKQRRTVVVLWFDQVLPSLHDKDNVEVNLGVGVCHFISFMPGA